MQLNPQFFQAYANRALVYRNMGKPVEAAADYNMALKINPNYDVAYIGGATSTARPVASTRLSVTSTAPSSSTRPTVAPTQSRLDLSAARRPRQGDRRFLEGDLALAARAEPYNGRGVSYVALNDDDNAFADFNLAIELNGNIAESWANQALVYERRGDKARAAKSYSHALRLDPKYEPAKQGLARTRTAT